MGQNFLFKKIDSCTGIAHLGLESGYTQKSIQVVDYIQAIQTYQHNLIESKRIYLSVSVSETRIVLDGQNEPHVRLEFLNYPRFPLAKELFKSEVIALVEHLMEIFQQNRTVIVFTDETIMLQGSNEVDPRISNGNWIKDGYCLLLQELVDENISKVITKLICDQSLTDIYNDQGVVDVTC